MIIYPYGHYPEKLYKVSVNYQCCNPDEYLYRDSIAMEPLINLCAMSDIVVLAPVMTTLGSTKLCYLQLFFLYCRNRNSLFFFNSF